MINLSKIKHIGIGVIIGSLLTASVSFSSNPIKLIINSKEIENAEAILIEGRTYVPLRVIANSLGASVVYDSESNTVYIKSKDQGITGAIGSGPKPDYSAPVDPVEKVEKAVKEETNQLINNININNDIIRIDEYTIQYNNRIYHTLIEWANKHNMSKNDINWEQSTNSIIIQKTKIVNLDGINAIMYNSKIYLLSDI